MTLAHDSGINFFDNAEAYAVGGVRACDGPYFEGEGWPRDTWCVSSKVFWGGTFPSTPPGGSPTSKGLSRKHVIEACDAALRRLQVDYLVVLLPMAGFEYTDTGDGFGYDRLVRQGKISTGEQVNGPVGISPWRMFMLRRKI